MQEADKTMKMDHVSVQRSGKSENVFRILKNNNVVKHYPF